MSWIARAALRASRSPFGKLISADLIMDPCIVLDSQAAPRASLFLLGRNIRFDIIPALFRHGLLELHCAPLVRRLVN